MSKFKVGDRVIMSEASQYQESPGNPRFICGTVLRVEDGIISTVSYRVKWSNGHTNACYEDYDLDFFNDNVITTSSKTYRNDDELSDEDKDIITNYLQKELNLSVS